MMLHVILIDQDASVRYDLGAVSTDDPELDTAANQGRAAALLRKHDLPTHPDRALLIVRLDNGPVARIWRPRRLLTGQQNASSHTGSVPRRAGRGKGNDQH